MYKTLCIYSRTNGHCDVPPDPRADSLSHWLTKQRVAQDLGRLTPEQFRKLDVLGIFIKPEKRGSAGSAASLEQRWEANFVRLVAFQKQFGHARVPQNWKPDQQLATWVGTQRKNYRCGRLTPEHFERLDKVGIVWQVNSPRVVIWEQRFARLVAYKNQFGHCDVPCHWKEDVSLGQWVSDQREMRRKRMLRQERIDRLDQIGFKWTVFRMKGVPPAAFQPGLSARDQYWNHQFAALRQFKKQHDYCRVTQANGQQGRLYNWVLRQRSAERDQTLSAKHRRRLEKIGFEWKGREVSHVQWETRFAQLIAYQQAHGHCDVPCHWTEDRCFGHWVSNLRSFRRKGQLSQERIDRLDRLGFKWVIQNRNSGPSTGNPGPLIGRIQRWEDKFARLLEFKQQHGHCRVPPQDGLNGRLGIWAAGQRKMARDHKLSPERRQRLDEIGFPWTVKHDPDHAPASLDKILANQDRHWENMLAALAAYKAGHGHCNVRRGEPGLSALSIWVGSQRRAARLGQLRAARRQRLDDLGFIWDGKYSSNEKWVSYFARLEAFHQRYGHVDVPTVWAQDPALGHWVSNQRTRHRTGRLESDRTDRLEKLGFRWAIRLPNRSLPVARQAPFINAGLIWERRLAEWLQFKAQQGHDRIPRRLPQWRSLHVWISNQRQAYIKGQLPLHRRQQLEAHGFRWEAHYSNWDLWLEKLRAFQRQHGHCRVSVYDPELRRLANWVREQRVKQKEGRLYPERQQQLDALGFKWTIPRGSRIPPASPA